MANQSNKKALQIILVCLVIWGCVVATLPSHTRARQDKPTPINQGWHIVADIPPSHLEDELKKLNKDGYTVSKTDILAAGDKFTVILNADQDAGADDDDERRDK